MGYTEEATKKRVARAVEKLRLIFKKQGIQISATALSAGLAQASHQFFDLGALTRKISKEALRTLTVPASGLAGSNLALEILSDWKWAKIRTAFVAVAWRTCHRQKNRFAAIKPIFQGPCFYWLSNHF